jgi:nitroimidazol reductase NimA-like FMN-containing flavoprotein (pyridoxamine 5'-phosphate oxidase superfamily)
MRRKEREIKDKNEIEAIINSASVCRLAMIDEDYPYIVPLCFGYEDNTLYFHSAGEGKKLDILRKNKRVGFEFDIDQRLKMREKACDSGMAYKSVIGIGKAYFLKDPQSKRKALDFIMRNYADGSFEYSDPEVKNTTVIKVEIEQMTGKACP